MGGVINDTITFYINNVEYKSPKGYTFAQWVNTSYNYNGWYKNSNRHNNIENYNTNTYIYNDDGSAIVDGKRYTTKDIMISFMIGGDTYDAKIGSTWRDWINGSGTATPTHPWTIYNNKYATNVIEAVYVNNDEGVVSVSKTNELGNKTVREYRYSGNVSTNYVWFNCKDGYTSGEKNCERWRIVGSFYNNTGYASLKIVRLDALSKKYAYNSNGNNNYENSSVYKYLNTEYYKSLESSAKALILNTKWYIGSSNASLTPGELYDEEAKKTVMANVGLLSLSDYGYANSSSNWQLKITETNYKNSSWLYNENKQLLINATSDNSNNSYVVGSNIIDESVKILFLVRPSVYLRSDVSIINGLGTFNEPYELKINFPLK